MFLFSGPLLPNPISSHCIVEYKGQIIITGGMGLQGQGYMVLLFRLNDTEEIGYVKYTANVLSAEFTDECLRTKSKDN